MTRTTTSFLRHLTVLPVTLDSSPIPTTMTRRIATKTTKTMTRIMTITMTTITRTRDSAG